MIHKAFTERCDQSDDRVHEFKLVGPSMVECKYCQKTWTDQGLFIDVAREQMKEGERMRSLNSVADTCAHDSVKANTIDVEMNYRCSHCGAIMREREGMDSRRYLQCENGHCAHCFRPAPKPHAYVTIMPHGAVLSVK
jgi:DNA-directed RNA polymerase subunit RPC12/RpoP